MDLLLSSLKQLTSELVPKLAHLYTFTLKRNVFFSQLKSYLVCSLQAQSLLQQYKVFTLGTVS